jgi:uncharacterized membrane protein
MPSRTSEQGGTTLRALAAVRSGALSMRCIAILSVWCLLAGVAVRWSEDFHPTWNLFLAWIPLVLAYALSWAARFEAGWFVIPALGAAWLVFLPNAPYLVTDLVHMHGGASAQNAALLTLALTGLLIGIKAVQIVQRLIELHLGERAARRIVPIIAVLVAFGVYLGRVQRWNSWTVIEQPRAFVHAALAVPSQPGRVVAALFTTLIFAFGFSVAYRVLSGPSAEVPTRRPPAPARRGADS